MKEPCLSSNHRERLEDLSVRERKAKENKKKPKEKRIKDRKGRWQKSWKEEETKGTNESRRRKWRRRDAKAFERVCKGVLCWRTSLETSSEVQSFKAILDFKSRWTGKIFLSIQNTEKSLFIGLQVYQGLEGSFTRLTWSWKRNQVWLIIAIMATEGEESLPLTITDLRSYFDLKPVRVKRRVSLFPLLGLLLLAVTSLRPDWFIRIVSCSTNSPQRDFLKTIWAKTN